MPYKMVIVLRGRLELPTTKTYGRGIELTVQNERQSFTLIELVP